MKILHTSDWHLGKKLEGRSRLEEQKLFLEEIKKICNIENIDILVVAGDIYDSPHPSSEAERLYFDSIKDLSNKGKRAVIIISGNHDSGDKLLVADSFAKEFAVISFGKPLEKKECGFYGEFQIIESYEGAIVLKKENKEIFINLLPYASEKNLNEIWEKGDGEQKAYSKRIGELLFKSYQHKRKELKSMLVSHLFTIGANNEGSEREIELGGSLAFDLQDAPKYDYIALGHIHRPIEFKKANCVYSGSPMEFRISESKFSKCVYIKDFDNMELKKIPLKNHKEIKAYTLYSIEEAIEKAKYLENENQWIYFYIECNRPLQANEIKEIKKNKNIVEIIPRIEWEDDEEFLIDNYTGENIKEAFLAFYKSERNISPEPSTLDAFLELIQEVEHETN